MFQIKDRWTGTVRFECELGADIAGEPHSYQLGYAVRKGVESGADLRGADLRGADLRGANLSGAKVADAVMIQRAPLQLQGLKGWPVTIFDDHMQIGCELHSLVEWAGFDDARIARMGGSAALRFWRAHKAALLGLAASDGRGAAVTPAPEGGAV